MINIKCLPRITEEHIQQIQAAAGQATPEIIVAFAETDRGKISQVSSMLQAAGYRIRHQHATLTAQKEG